MPARKRPREAAEYCTHSHVRGLEAAWYSSITQSHGHCSGTRAGTSPRRGRPILDARCGQRGLGARPAPASTAAVFVAARWAHGSIGGGLAGVLAGWVGGLILTAAPEAPHPRRCPVLAVIGGCCGAAGGRLRRRAVAGESVARSAAPPPSLGRRTRGALVGSIVQWFARWAWRAVRDRHRTGGASRGFSSAPRRGLAMGGDAAFGRRSAAPGRPARGRRHHRGSMRPRRPGSGIEGTAAGRRHHPSHRPGVGGIGGDVDAVGPAGRRAGFWSLDRCTHRCE